MDRLDDISHRRWNPLTQTWVLCSPHRAKRPWQGQVEKLMADRRPQYDPKCYLCPGNVRVGGHQNPQYKSTFAFPNDFPAVRSDITPLKLEDPSGLFIAESTRGECHVICFHPDHNLTIAQMASNQLLPIIDAWVDIYKKFIDSPTISYCQIFENKGEMMGCSNPHPHGQVWATEQIPEEPRRELLGFDAYKQKNGADRCLLCDYAKAEQHSKVRVVCENDNFISVVPWWAVWPFETMIISKTHLTSLLDFSIEKKKDLCDIWRRVACKYDNLFECSFPYSMGIHQAPCQSDRSLGDVNNFHFHIHFYPPLLRSATVKKFLVGFEMLGTPQRDLTSEQAAEKLRNVAEQHYLNK